MSLAAPLLAAGGSDSGEFWPFAYPIIPHPVDLIFGVVVFAGLYWAVKKYVVPRLEGVLAERAEAIEGGLKKAEVAQAEAADALRHYQEELAQARAERGRIIQEAAQEAATVAAEIRQRAQEEANRITTAASQQIQAERQQAMVQLRAEVGSLAVDLAERIVGESLRGEARQSGVVDRFLDELEATAPSVSGRGA